jgi:hypothetical protein
MVSYKELGFVNTREMFKKAMEGKYAVPAYNFNNMEQLQAIVNACGKSGSPVILQVSSGARKYADSAPSCATLGQGAVAMAREAGFQHPHRPPPGPRRHLRALQVLHRLRVQLGHDRRLAPLVRAQRRIDLQGC